MTTPKQTRPETDEGYAVEYSIYPVKWTPYHPTEVKRRKDGKKGRWQRLSEYCGWDNCPTPSIVYKDAPDVKIHERVNDMWFVGGWHWWASEDGERYTAFDKFQEVAVDQVAKTIEFDEGEVDADGKMHATIFVTEARRDAVRLSRWLLFNFDQLLENAELEAQDLLTDGDEEAVFDAITPKQQTDLERRLKAECDRWQIENNLRFETQSLTKMRNDKEVSVEIKP